MNLVSIAMTTYNGEKFIAEQLESLMKQTYKNLEIIICDDSSTDKTIEIIKSYMQKDSRIQLFQNSENLGVLKNFEKAISLCKGAFIALSDQDDIWIEDKIELLAQNMENKTLIFHDDFLIDTNNTIKETSFLKKEGIDAYGLNSIKKILCDNWILGHALMFDAKLKNKIIPIPQVIEHFDLWIVLIAILNGEIKFIDSSLIYWRQHESNTSGNKLIHRNLIEKIFFPIDRDTFILWNKSRLNRLNKIKYLNIINNKSDRNFLDGLINYYMLQSRFKAFLFSIVNINFIVSKKGILRKIKYILLPLFAPKVDF